MRSKTLLIAILFSILLFAVFSLKNIHAKSDGNKKEEIKIEIVSVDDVIRSPEEYKSYIGVQGTVSKVNKSKKVFLLGCEDACIYMPVKFEGTMPDAENKIIVYGEISKQKDGKYIFHAKEVRLKK